MSSSATQNRVDHDAQRSLSSGSQCTCRGVRGHGGLHPFDGFGSPGGDRPDDQRIRRGVRQEQGAGVIQRDRFRRRLERLSIEVYFNGQTTTSVDAPLTGTVAAGDTFVFADSDLEDFADQTTEAICGMVTTPLCWLVRTRPLSAVNRSRLKASSSATFKRGASTASMCRTPVTAMARRLTQCSSTLPERTRCTSGMSCASVEPPRKASG